MPYTTAPALQPYETRDGCLLHYRHYPADAGKTVILLHGITEDGKYLHPLAEYLSTISASTTTMSKI